MCPAAGPRWLCCSPRVALPASLLPPLQRGFPSRVLVRSLTDSRPTWRTQILFLWLNDSIPVRSHRNPGVPAWGVSCALVLCGRCGEAAFREQAGKAWGVGWGTGACRAQGLCPGQELEQQLLIEKRNYRKTLKFYQKLLQKEKRSKGTRGWTAALPGAGGGACSVPTLPTPRLRGEDHVVQTEGAAGRNEVQSAVPGTGQEVPAGKSARIPAHPPDR